MSSLNESSKSVEEIAREAYRAGWKQSIGREEYQPIHIRTMNSNFDSWWKPRYGD